MFLFLPVLDNLSLKSNIVILSENLRGKGSSGVICGHEFPSPIVLHLCEYGLKKEHFYNVKEMFGAQPWPVLLRYSSSIRGGNESN